LQDELAAVVRGAKLPVTFLTALYDEGIDSVRSSARDRGRRSVPKRRKRRMPDVSPPCVRTFFGARHAYFAPLLPLTMPRC